MRFTPTRPKFLEPAARLLPGPLKRTGVFLGRFKNNYLRYAGPEHIMAFAPTRSGKGVGLVVPTLLSWSESTVIHDIKGENWQLTAGWHSTFSQGARVPEVGAPPTLSTEQREERSSEKEPLLLSFTIDL